MLRRDVPVHGVFVGVDPRQGRPSLVKEVEVLDALKTQDAKKRNGKEPSSILASTHIPTDSLTHNLSEDIVCKIAAFAQH